MEWGSLYSEYSNNSEAMELSEQVGKKTAKTSRFIGYGDAPVISRDTDLWVFLLSFPVLISMVNQVDGYQVTTFLDISGSIGAISEASIWDRMVEPNGAKKMEPVAWIPSCHTSPS